MGLRYLGNIIKPGYNPLASNITTGVNVVQYQGVFTAQQQLQAQANQQWAKDPYDYANTLLLQADGIANGSQNNTFLDSSTNNFTITRNGNTTQGTFTPFSQQPGWWSNYFDGSSNITLSSAAVQTNGAFTVECWLYITNNTGTGSQGFYTQYAAADGARMQMLFDDSDKKFKLTIGGSSYPSTQAYPGVYNTWTHVVFTRDGSNNFSFYVNGLRDSVTAVTAAITSVNPMIGNRNGGGIPFYGYISNLRITTTAVYSGASFAVPNLPLGQVSGALLLTCQSYRFVDNSASPLTLTPAGTPSVQAFSPFAPQYQWTSDVIGGSGYFDGSGDYLSLADNAAFTLGSGDFTIECWAYTTAWASQYNVMICQWNVGTSFIFRITSSLIGLYANIGGTQNYTASVTNNLYTWNHFAVTRSGTTLTFYKNGTSVGTATISGTIADVSDNLTIGILGDANSTTAHTGYISGLRLIKDSAVAPTITSPPTAITNTSLLLNFTNAGIYDGTLKNNLETVGNAQVSTSVVKYGSGSMYFDGSGDGLLSPISKFFDFGSGDFTVEFWANCVSTSGQGYFVSVWEDSGGSDSNSSWLIRLNSGTIITHFMQGGATYNTLTSPTISTNTWFHFAWVRNGNTQTMYINGVAVASSSISGAMNSVIRQFRVAYQGAATNYFNGYIDDLRITKGVARYTANFIPPSVALPRQ